MATHSKKQTTPRAIAFLQARVSSSRLPAKVLLPIGGLPLAVLAARRAANTGRKVVVLTSIEKSDDALCETLKNFGVEFIRGDLDNVLSRFVEACDGMPGSMPFFRLTADNVFPDGAFLDSVEAQFHEIGAEYMACSHPASGLPYGVSAEISTVSKLRDALNCSNDRFDLEHVTPHIKRNCVTSVYEPNSIDVKASDLRCTVDTLDDYLLVESLFRDIEAPDLVSLDSVIQLLEKHSN